MHTKIRAQIGVAVAVLALALSGAPASQANLTGSSFDTGDGNLLVDDEATDWANAGIDCSSTTGGCGIDLPTGQGDNSFGNGTKEDDPVPTVVNGSIPNNKSDLLRFYTKMTQEGGKDFLYLAWERVQEPNGTTNMDFEFNQSKVPSDNGVTPVRTAGDILVKYDLSQGGTNPTLGYHEWITTGNPRTDCEASNSLPCWGTVNALTGFFEGSINNDGPVTDPIAPDAGRTLSVRTFGEAAINLTDSGIIPANTCLPFASAYLKSRSSDSFTSAVKDFIAPISAGASRCGTINITKVNDDSPASALQGAVFTLYNDASPVGTALGAEDTPVSPATTCTTSAAGTCSFSNVPIGNYWVVETTTPAGHDTAAPQQAVVGAGATVALTFVNPRDFKVIVLVCNEATNSLYPSQVTLDGSTPAKTSLGAAPTGVTAAQLCGLGGAAFDDQSYGSHTAGVTIPQ